MKLPVFASHIFRLRMALVAGTSALALTASLVPAPVLAAPSDEAMAEAQAAYQEGEKAYRLGKFDEAAEFFEKAYELSDLPDILYNIGLAHLRWFDVDPEVSHLRKAKVVLQNYIVEIQKNPDLGDRAEAEALIAEIDKKIEEAQAAEAAANAGPDPAEQAPVDVGPDPGKPPRLAGSIAMGVGGAFIVAGVVSGVVLGVRGQEFEQELANVYAQQTARGCQPDDMRPECTELEVQATTFRDNGQLANTLAVGLGLSLGGVGAIGLVSGVVLFVQGTKKTRRWEQNQLSMVPSIGRGSAGLTISGRF